MIRQARPRYQNYWHRADFDKPLCVLARTDAEERFSEGEIETKIEAITAVLNFSGLCVLSYIDISIEKVDAGSHGDRVAADS
jgi:hypothetical protein